MKKYFILLILALFACKPDPPEPPDPYLFQAEDFIIDEGVSPQVYYENDGIMFYSQGMAYQNIDVNAGDYQVFLVCQQWTPDDENVMLEIINPSGVLQIEVKSDTLTYITFYVHLNESGNWSIEPLNTNTRGRKFYFDFMRLIPVSAYTVIWDRNEEQDIDHYNVYWGQTEDVINRRSVGKQTSIKLVGLDKDIEYFFAVTAVDNSGNESEFSDIVSSESANIRTRSTGGMSIDLLNEVMGGRGTYSDPFVIAGDVIQWTHKHSDISANSLYMTTIHACTHRSCVTMYKADEQTDFDKIHKAVLNVGTFYIRTHLNGKQVSKIFITCQVPFNTVWDGWFPPANAIPPVVKLNIHNEKSPGVINGDVIEFDIAGSSNVSVYWWAIQTTGHPIYGSGYSHSDVRNTHIYDINKSWKWDTRAQPSDNGKYRLDVSAYNEHGQRTVLSYNFVRDGYEKPDDETEPGIVQNVRVIKL